MTRKDPAHPGRGVPGPPPATRQATRSGISDCLLSAPPALASPPPHGDDQSLDSAIPSQRIAIRGAYTHNLRNIDLGIPRNQLAVITGLSGSGKSSLAFDTLYAEGLSPAIAIEQKPKDKLTRR